MGLGVVSAVLAYWAISFEVSAGKLATLQGSKSLPKTSGRHLSCAKFKDTPQDFGADWTYMQPVCKGLWRPYGPTDNILMAFLGMIHHDS